jgi:hypothetical protein
VHCLTERDDYHVKKSFENYGKCTNAAQGLLCGTWTNWPGREADHSILSCTEVKNAWSCTTTPPIHLQGVALNKAMDTSSWRGT